MGIGDQRHAPADIPPREWPGTHLYRRLGGPHSPLWSGAANLAPTGFDPRTVQPVASRYTDWAIRTHNLGNMPVKKSGSYLIVNTQRFIYKEHLAIST